MTDISVTNFGSITSTGYGVYVSAPQLSDFGTVSITNTLGASIRSTLDAVKITATVLDTSATGDFTLQNGGLIEAYGAGSHAVDFGDLISPLATVSLTNQATGQIVANNGTAVLAGAEDTIVNFGGIAGFSEGSAGCNGIDFQSNPGGVVENFAGAGIAGAENGITGTQPITVINAGLIVGYAGCGIDMETASNAATTVISNSGTVIGETVNSAPSGDAINVNGVADIENSGQIKALGTSAGTLAEGVSVGGGAIYNYVGGVIYSSQRAITVDGGGTADNTGLSAFAAAKIVNYGTIQGNDGEAIVITGDFADTIDNVGAIIGSVFTGGGDDVINLFTGSSISGLLDGGAGNDTVNLFGSGVGDLASFVNIETINLNGGDWTLGSEGVNDVVFAPGLDTLRLASGVLADGTFSGTLDHFAPGDVIDLEGVGLATGASLGAGNLLTISGAPGGPITLQLDAADNFTGDVFQVATDNAGGTLLTLGEALNGGNGNLVLNGGPGSDIINAGNGNDVISGGGGNDVVNAGNGNDTINDGAGNDALKAGNGNDVISAGGGADTINAGNGRDFIDAGDGNDTVNAGNGNDSIDVGDGNDTIKVGNGNDVISAGSGTDVITAGNGNDTINGGAGNDIIKAGNGNDIINGGAGNDILTAGVGNDRFVFSAGFGKDTVTDFHSGDHIEFEDHLFMNFAAVQAASVQVGTDVVITLDAADTVTLQHTALASLHASDFLLS